MLPKGNTHTLGRHRRSKFLMFQHTNQGFQSLVCNSKTNNEFLYYLMSTKKGELEEKASGSTFLEISPSEVKSILVSVPSFNEQCLISEVLSESDSQIQSIENLIKKKRDIKKGTMQYLSPEKFGYQGLLMIGGQRTSAHCAKLSRD